MPRAWLARSRRVGARACSCARRVRARARRVRDAARKDRRHDARAPERARARAREPAELATCRPTRRFEREGCRQRLAAMEAGRRCVPLQRARAGDRQDVGARGRCASRRARRFARAAGRRRRCGRAARTRARLARAGRAADPMGPRGAREGCGRNRVSRRRPSGRDPAGRLEDRISRLRRDAPAAVAAQGVREPRRLPRAAFGQRVALSVDAAERSARMLQSWDSNADAWTDAVRERRIASRRAGTDDAVVAAVLRTKPPSVLDVGCGEGWLARALAAHGCRVAGIDASEGLIASARNLGCGTFFAMTYAALGARASELGAPFDIAVCNFSLLEAELAPLLGVLRDMLTARGRLVIQTVHPWVACGGEPYTDGWREETFA